VNNLITVREFARLTTAEVTSPTLDRAQVTASAFDWLCQLRTSIGSTGFVFATLEDRRAIRLDSFVGVLETPCGTRIEILPKIASEDSATDSREILRRMISVALDLPVREATETQLQRFAASISEWVMEQFLTALKDLLKKGVRFEYVRTEAVQRFLRGQLDPARQLRQPPGRQHHFHVRQDNFLPDRPENRLIKLALEQVARAARSTIVWRLAQELRTLFGEVPASTNVAEDFRQWRGDRLTAHYKAIRPWCELILYRQMPYSLLGSWTGISFLFPMAKLFERYVALWIRQNLEPGASLRTQAASEYLCHHDGERIFRLEPDLLLQAGDRRWILDTKWKLISSLDRSGKYGLSQPDFYQLYAYGAKYLGRAGGELALIFPATPTFSAPLPVFEFETNLRLWALPFDLLAYRLTGHDLPQLPLRSSSNAIRSMALM
jgi:5-methylcytosine-specific restriction enzyme subunit McrC